MERIIFLIFLCTGVEGRLGRHIFVSNRKSWDEAQDFCRDRYNDLSFVDNQIQDQLVAFLDEEDNDDAEEFGSWIGLQRDPSNMTTWKWSGGGSVTYTNWKDGQPDNYMDRDNKAAMASDGKWYDDNGANKKTFFCISLTTREMKPWEEALKHCRENQKNLSSLLSETDHQIARIGIQRERVWIGLRYLHDRWMWVNGDPLVYKAWPQGGDQDHQCPLWKRCGALTKEGLWENWDCQDELDFICS